MLSKQEQRKILGKKVEALRKTKGIKQPDYTLDGRLAVVPK